MFQFQCGRSSSQTGYPSSPWWAVTPPTSYWDADSSLSDSLQAEAIFPPNDKIGSVFGISDRFQPLSPS